MGTPLDCKFEEKKWLKKKKKITKIFFFEFFFSEKTVLDRILRYRRSACSCIPKRGVNFRPSILKQQIYF